MIRLNSHQFRQSATRANTGPCPMPPAERGSTSGRMADRKERVDSARGLEFQATLLRVAEPRSDSTPALSGALPANSADPELQFPRIAVSLNPHYATGRHQEIPEPTAICPVSHDVYRWQNRGDSASRLSLRHTAFGRCRRLSGSAHGPSGRNDHRLAVACGSIGVLEARSRRRVRHPADFALPNRLVRPALRSRHESIFLWHFLRATLADSISP